jgi:hypothetical protein
MPDDRQTWQERAAEAPPVYCPTHPRTAMVPRDGALVCPRCELLARAMAKQKKRRKGC